MKVALACLALLLAIAVAQDADSEKDIHKPEYDSDVAFYFSPIRKGNNQNRNKHATRGPSSHRTRRPRYTRRPRITRDWDKWTPSQGKNSFDWKSFVNSGSFQQSSYDWRSYIPSQFRSYVKPYNSFGSSGQDNWHSFIPSEYRSYVKSFDYSSYLPSKEGSGQGSFVPSSAVWRSYIPSQFSSYVKSYNSFGSSGQDNWHSFIPSEYRSYIKSFDYSSYLPSKEGSGYDSFVPNSSESSGIGSFQRSFDSLGSSGDSFDWHSYVPSEHRSYLKSFDNSAWQSYVPSSYGNKFGSA